MINERKNRFKATVLRHFAKQPTNDQFQALEKLAEFLFDTNLNPLFILKGYAGTGKTSLMGAFIKTCDEYKVNTILMAPTGRAAKVLSTHSQKKATTVHKRIYFRITDKHGNVRYKLQNNFYKKTIFIVDEASMIGDSNIEIGASILEDLLSYVYAGTYCRLIFIGDNAQLPPVGFSDSPALEAEYLQSVFRLSVHTALLKQVMRQTNQSGILYNATWLRVQLYKNTRIYPQLKTSGFTDVIKINGEQLADCLEESYRQYGNEGTIVITRSNKNANLYNKQIRLKIKWKDSMIESGDVCMVVKNNYFWLQKDSEADFIANGDFIEIEKISKIKELYGFKFAQATIRLLDYPNHAPVEVNLWLDTLETESAAMPEIKVRELYNKIMEDLLDVPSKATRKELVLNNPFFNALQIKFGYCVTCHKSQGGQWSDVYIDPGYLTPEMINEDFYRWLYTAITRASKRVYLINFKDDFFSEDE